MRTAKRVRTWAMVALFAALLVIPVSVGAQRATDNDTTRQELQRFDQFLDNHPQIAMELKKNPSLVNDPTYVRQHRELGDFLEDHPRVREELRENPGAFMSRERGLERSENGQVRRPDNDTTRGELASFDHFLDNHPSVAKELSKNPKLVDDPVYLSQHPALKDYLEDHPRVREEIKENPNAFMGRERRFEKREGKGAKQHPKPKDRDRGRDRH